MLPLCVCVYKQAHLGEGVPTCAQTCQECTQQRKQFTFSFYDILMLCTQEIICITIYVRSEQRTRENGKPIRASSIHHSFQQFSSTVPQAAPRLSYATCKNQIERALKEKKRCTRRQAFLSRYRCDLSRRSFVSFLNEE